MSLCSDAAPLDQRRSLLRPMSTAAAAAVRDTIARTCDPQPVDAAGGVLSLLASRGRGVVGPVACRAMGTFG